MKKRIPVKWIILTVVLALLLGFIVWLITIIPVHSLPEKYLDSYEDLQQALEDHPEICLPELSSLALTDTSYKLLLDGRDILSEPEGYEFCGTAAVNGTQVDYVIRCSKNSGHFSSPDTVYCGIPLKYYDDTLQRHYDWGEVSFKYISVNFPLGDFYCSFSAEYPHTGMSEEEMTALENDIMPQLIELSHHTIDTYTNR